MTIKRTKASVRASVLGRIAAMDPAIRRHQENRLTDLLPGLPGFASARTILLYVSAFADEVDTGSMLRSVIDRGKRLVCPRIVPNTRTLDLHEVDDLPRDLVLGHGPIREPRTGCPRVGPEEIDWVLVPGVAFDRRGYRLGRGGGYYDRLLPVLRPDAVRWALILTPQWVDEMPREPHDCRLDGVSDFQEIWVASSTREFTPP